MPVTLQEPMWLLDNEFFAATKDPLNPRDITPNGIANRVGEQLYANQQAIASFLNGLTPIQSFLPLTPVNNGQTLERNKGYVVAATAAFGVLLPTAGVVNGDRIQLTQQTGNARLYPLTLSTSGGATIDGDTSWVMETAFFDVTLVYEQATTTWKVSKTNINDALVSGHTLWSSELTQDNILALSIALG